MSRYPFSKADLSKIYWNIRGIGGTECNVKWKLPQHAKITYFGVNLTLNSHVYLSHHYGLLTIIWRHSHVKYMRAFQAFSFTSIIIVVEYQPQQDIPICHNGVLQRALILFNQFDTWLCLDSESPWLWWDCGYLWILGMILHFKNIFFEEKVVVHIILMHECGRVIRDKYTWLKASMDGLIRRGSQIDGNLRYEWSAIW